MRLSRVFATVLAAAAASTAFAQAPPSARGASAGAPAAAQKVDPWVLSTGANGPTEFVVFLSEQADLRGANLLVTKAGRARYVFDRLRDAADRTQAPLLELLDARGVEHRAFWVANMIWVRGDAALAEELAQRDDVAHVYANPTVHMQEPGRGPEDADAPNAPEPGVTRVRAPEVWATGVTGQTVVIAGQDTGYFWTHAALQGKYRGWNGTAADHNYNWHDSIHGCGPNSAPPCGGTCGLDSLLPCDDQGHGTHTMGTMVGDDGAGNQVGVAPGARWIGCRNMDRGDGSPASYSECFQWFIAPTNLNNQNPDPTKSPHVISNSWGCPPSEGCTDPNMLKTVVENTRAAGIVVVVSAGNSGPNCSTVVDPPAIYDAVLSVGATGTTNDAIASFSSRGPVTIDGSNRIKPDVSAPGVSVRSSLRTGGYGSMSGTSMASPHVAGVVALLLSAVPALKGQVNAIETAVQGGSMPLTSTQTCGGVPGTQIPNNTFGYGRVDAVMAIAVAQSAADLGVTSSAWPQRIRKGKRLSNTVTVANAGPLAATGVVVTQLLPGMTPTSAVASQGSCVLSANRVDCTVGAMAMGASVTITISATPTVAGQAISTVNVTSGQPDPVPANNSLTLQTRVVDCAPYCI